MFWNQINVTREQLHGRVWRETLTTIAAELGIGATALAGLCDKYEIARPPVGYWSRSPSKRITPPPPLSVAKWPGAHPIDDQVWAPPKLTQEERETQRAAAAETAAERAARWEKEYRLSQEKSARRRAQRRREEAIWQGLLAMAGDWNRAERLREFVDQVEARLIIQPNPPRAIRAWLKWARTRISGLDPLSKEGHALLASLPGISRHRYFRRKA